jgi:hypothetical protein
METVTNKTCDRIRIRACLLTFITLLSCFASESDTEVAEVGRVHSFTLCDQFKIEHKQVFPGSRIIVLTLADRKGSEQLEDWVTPFYKRYEEQVDIFGVANLKGVPGFMKPLLRKLFRKGLDYPVMMDWTGEICEALQYKAGKANIFILCPKGVIRHRINGKVTGRDLQNCFSEVDGLLKKQDEAAGAGSASGKEEDEAGTREAP